MAGAPSTSRCSSGRPRRASSATAPYTLIDSFAFRIRLSSAGAPSAVLPAQRGQHVLVHLQARRQVARRAGLLQGLGAAQVDGRYAQRQVARAVLHRVAPGEAAAGGRADGPFGQQQGRAAAGRDAAADVDAVPAPPLAPSGSPARSIRPARRPRSARSTCPCARPAPPRRARAWTASRPARPMPRRRRRVQEDLGRRQHGAAAPAVACSWRTRPSGPSRTRPGPACRPGTSRRRTARSDPRPGSPRPWAEDGRLSRRQDLKPLAGPLTTRLPAYPPLSFGTPKRARPLNDSAGCRPCPRPRPGSAAARGRRRSSGRAGCPCAPRPPGGSVVGGLVVLRMAPQYVARREQQAGRQRAAARCRPCPASRCRPRNRRACATADAS